MDSRLPSGGVGVGGHHQIGGAFADVGLIGLHRVRVAHVVDQMHQLRSSPTGIGSPCPDSTLICAEWSVAPFDQARQVVPSTVVSTNATGWRDKTTPAGSPPPAPAPADPARPPAVPRHRTSSPNATPTPRTAKSVARHWATSTYRVVAPGWARSRTESTEPITAPGAMSNGDGSPARGTGGLTSGSVAGRASNSALDNGIGTGALESMPSASATACWTSRSRSGGRPRSHRLRRCGGPESRWASAAAPSAARRVSGPAIAVTTGGLHPPRTWPSRRGGVAHRPLRSVGRCGSAFAQAHRRCRRWGPAGTCSVRSP